MKGLVATGESAVEHTVVAVLVVVGLDHAVTTVEMAALMRPQHPETQHIECGSGSDLPAPQARAGEGLRQPCGAPTASLGAEIDAGRRH